MSTPTVSSEMSTPTATRYNLQAHLRVLFKFLNFFALTGIVFNSQSQKFERPKLRQKVTGYVYKFIKYFSGFLVCTKCLYLFGIYIAYITDDILKSVEAQEEALNSLNRYVQTTSALIYALHYFRIEDNLLRLFNEVLKLFGQLKARIGPELFLSAHMVKVLIVKAVILTFIMKYIIAITIVQILCLFFNIDFTLFPVLNALMIFSYIYIQLILLCLYEKMNEYLQARGPAMERRELSKCLREFMSISRRIHAIKHTISGFASCVFFCTYIGLFHDIEYTYLLLKIVFYFKYFAESGESRFFLNIHYFPACFSFTFDIFVIGLLSDKLEDANNKFKATVERLSEDTPAMRRNVEVMLMRDNICGLGLQAFGHIKVNQQFSYDFTINNVLVFVIIFLQFFVAEQVYTKDFHKITIVRDYSESL